MNLDIGIAVIAAATLVVASVNLRVSLHTKALTARALDVAIRLRTPGHAQHGPVK